MIKKDLTDHLGCLACDWVARPFGHNHDGCATHCDRVRLTAAQDGFEQQPLLGYRLYR
jgi:hypothetical protein